MKEIQTRLVTVTGNEAAFRHKVAEKFVLNEDPEARILSSKFWGRDNGWPVYEIHYTTGTD